MNTPCEEDPEAWVGDDATLRAEAAALCGGCPVIEQCRAFAEANDERWGVWAGIDRGLLPRTADVTACVMCEGALAPRGSAKGPLRPVCDACSVKACAVCGAEFTYTGTRSSPATWRKRLYCGLKCSGKGIAAARRAARQEVAA